MPVYKMKNQKGWYCSFYSHNPFGNRKRIKKEGFSTKKEALAYERNYLQSNAANPDMPMQQLYDLYHKDCQLRLKATTVINLEAYWKNYLQPYFSNLSCAEVTAAVVRQWQNQMLQKALSPATLLTAHKILSSILNFGVRYYQLTNNPAKICGSMGKNIVSSAFWTWDDFQKANACICEDPANLMLNLLFYGGMRCGELMALTWQDILFAENAIQITKTRTRIHGNDVMTPPKTKKSIRIICMPDFVMEKIQNYRQSFYQPADTDFLFPCSVHVIRYAIRKASLQTGVPAIRIHDLRHSHASLLVELGFSPLLIAQRLGHENVQTTLQIYSHLYPKKQTEVATKLEEKMVRSMYASDSHSLQP